jgi:hypothetical protein
MCLRGKIRGAIIEKNRWKIPEEYIDSLVSCDDDDFRDALGNVVPDHMRDTFKSKQLKDLIRALNAAIREYVYIRQWNPFMSDKIMPMMVELKKMIVACSPHHVCPCENGCKECRGVGWVPNRKRGDTITS